MPLPRRVRERDTKAVEDDDTALTAAQWYNLYFHPTPVNIKLSAREQTLTFGSYSIVCLHTPGLISL